MVEKQTKHTKDNLKNIEGIIKTADGGALNSFSEATKIKYKKEEIFGAVNKVVDDNKKLINDNDELKELNKMLGDKKMDDKDIKILENTMDKLVGDRLKDMQGDLNERFDGLAKEVKVVKDKSEETCKDGKCFTTKIDDVTKTLSEITELLANNKTSEEITNVKTDVEDKINKITEDISGRDSKINEDISELTSKMGEVCTGIDCIKKRFETEDDLVECPNKDCKSIFSLSANTIGDTIVCPNCKTILESY